MPAYLRQLGQLIERHLFKGETSLHWVAVVGEDSVQKIPERMWAHDDHLLLVTVAPGHSEGALLYVNAQANRYKPEAIEPLFRIKLLCGPHAAFDEAKAVWDCINSKEFAHLAEHGEESGDFLLYSAIEARDQDGAGFWNNSTGGWSTAENATRFSAEERDKFSLPSPPLPSRYAYDAKWVREAEVAQPLFEHADPAPQPRG